MSRLLILFLICSYLSLFNTGCSILHPNSLEKEKGYYTNHLSSCGPRAVQKAVMDLRKVGIWNKRYITLAPVANLMGIAFNLKDPNNLLNKSGVTLALVERNHLNLIQNE